MSSIFVGRKLRRVNDRGEWRVVEICPNGSVTLRSEGYTPVTVVIFREQLNRFVEA